MSIIKDSGVSKASSVSLVTLLDSSSYQYLWMFCTGKGAATIGSSVSITISAPGYFNSFDFSITE